MSVRVRQPDARLAWNLLVGAQPLGEPESTTMPTAEILALWRAHREPLLEYCVGPCWGEMIFEMGLSDDEARRRIDALMSWDPQ